MEEIRVLGFMHFGFSFYEQWVELYLRVGLDVKKLRNRKKKGKRVFLGLEFMFIVLIWVIIL